MRDRQTIHTPTKDLVEAATELGIAGIINYRLDRGVLCSNSDDRDFPPADPDCAGIIILSDNLDEAGGDYSCPLCERAVYPDARRKQRVPVLVSELNREGIERLVLEMSGFSTATIVDQGVLIESNVPQNRVICIVDFSGAPTFAGRPWLKEGTCIAITIDPRFRIHLRSMRDVKQIELIDLLIGKADLADMLPQVWPESQVVDITNRATPLERKKHNRSEKIGIWLSDEGIMANGILLRFDTLALPYLSFAAVYYQALKDLHSEQEFTPLPAEEVARRTNSTESNSVQQAFSRADARIVTRLKQAGYHVDKGDIIENVRRRRDCQGRTGFRLNPDRVFLALRA